MDEPLALSSAPPLPAALANCDEPNNQAEDQKQPPTKKQRLQQQDLAVKQSSNSSTQQSEQQHRRPASKKKQSAVQDTRPSIQLYLDIKNPAVGQPVHISRHPTHTAPQFKILDGPDGVELSEEAMASNTNVESEIKQYVVYNEKGYRMCKASHGVSTGRWYFECTILAPLFSAGNLRIGWSQISGDLQGPCGYDAFSYSYRARPPTRFHQSRPVEYGVDYLEPGTVLGCLIDLPLSLSDSAGGQKQSFCDIAGKPCDPLPAEWNGVDRYITVPYFGNRPIYRGSQIRFFVNGEDQGVAFEDIYAGKYYPAVSSYFGGRVSVNFGKQPFQCGDRPPMDAQPMCRIESNL